MKSEKLQSTDPEVIACMGSAPECSANGCQFKLTQGYPPGEGPLFRFDGGKLRRVWALEPYDAVIQWFQQEFGYNCDPASVPCGEVLRWALALRQQARAAGSKSGL